MSSLLLIDQSESIRSLAKWALGSDFAIIESSTIQNAPELIRQNSPEIMVVDYAQLKTAPHLMAEITQSGEPLPNLVVMLHPDECKDALSFSVDHPIDFLVKPFDELSLKYRISRNRKIKRGHILALDTTGFITPQLKRAIVLAGFELTIRDHDRDFAELLKITQPVLVILDSSLPQLNRNAIISEIHKMDTCKLISVIDPLLTPEHAQQLISQSDDFVTKPVSGLELNFRVQRLVDTPPAPQTPITFSKSVPRVILSQNGNSNRNGHTNGNGHSILNGSQSTENVDTKSLLGQVYVTLHHEMRSPLTGILIGAQALEKQLNTDQQPVAREIAESARRIRNTLDRLSIANAIGSEEYMNGTPMAKFESDSAPTFNWA
ncbi:hypothetical protein EBR96_04885 [bacterium]|nr:hypothetical protein [bacterium]